MAEKITCQFDRETTMPNGPVPPAMNPGTAKAKDPFCVAPSPLFGAVPLRPAVYQKLNEPGPVQATWNAGDTVDIWWDLLAPHGGKISYYLCLDGSDTWECFQQNPMNYENGNQFGEMSLVPGPHKDRLIVPDVQCDRCTIAWRWDASMEPSVFVNCADISITGGEDTPPQPEPQPGPTMPPIPPVPTYNPYMVLSLHDENKCLDLFDGNTENGAAIGIWFCNGRESQRWCFQDGKLMLASDNSKCIDVPATDERPAAGTALQIWDCNGSPSQGWGFDADAGTVYLVNSGDASLCLDLPGGDTSDGQIAQVWDCNAASQQKFYVPPPFGTFNIAAGVDEWKCLDVPGQNAVNGARLQIWDCNGIMGQQWLFDEDKIRYKQDPSKCVDAPGGEVQQDSLLWLWDCNGSPGQSLGYDYNTRTIYFADSKDASMCWNLLASDGSNGNSISVQPCNDDAGQQWNVGTGHLAALKSRGTEMLA